MRLLTALLCCAVVSGCGTFVPVTDVSKVAPERMQAAYKVQLFTAGSGAAHPAVETYLGDVTAYSCKHMLYDPPASTGNAMAQLRLKALDLGADGVIDVSVDTRGTDALGTNCWESVQASGVAVKFVH